jgi:hypothetical protein
MLRQLQIISEAASVHGYICPAIVDGLGDLPMSFTSLRLAHCPVFDIEIVCLERACTVVLKSKKNRCEESRNFDSWHTLRATLTEFISEQRLALADMKMEAPGHTATHNFAAVPLSLESLQELGFRLDSFDI